MNFNEIVAAKKNFMEAFNYLVKFATKIGLKPPSGNLHLKRKQQSVNVKRTERNMQKVYLKISEAPNASSVMFILHMDHFNHSSYCWLKHI